jgi:hypothetical protein
MKVHVPTMQPASFLTASVEADIAMFSTWTLFAIALVFVCLAAAAGLVRTLHPVSRGYQKDDDDTKGLTFNDELGGHDEYTSSFTDDAQMGLGGAFEFSSSDEDDNDPGFHNKTKRNLKEKKRSAGPVKNKGEVSAPCLRDDDELRSGVELQSKAGASGAKKGASASGANKGTFGAQKSPGPSVGASVVAIANLLEMGPEDSGSLI